MNYDLTSTRGKAFSGQWRVITVLLRGWEGWPIKTSEGLYLQTLWVWICNCPYEVCECEYAIVHKIEWNGMVIKWNLVKNNTPKTLNLQDLETPKFDTPTPNACSFFCLGQQTNKQISNPKNELGGVSLSKRSTQSSFVSSYFFLGFEKLGGCSLT